MVTLMKWRYRDDCISECDGFEEETLTVAEINALGQKENEQ